MYMVHLYYNLGFRGGCNRGIERALELGADYVFLLNNDTVVHEEAIRHLVDALEARPDAGMASALVLFPGDEQTIQFYRATLSRDTARHDQPGLAGMTVAACRDTVETEFAPACCVCFRSAALRQVRANSVSS